MGGVAKGTETNLRTHNTKCKEKYLSWTHISTKCIKQFVFVTQHSFLSRMTTSLRKLKMENTPVPDVASCYTSKVPRDGRTRLKQNKRYTSTHISLKWNYAELTHLQDQHNVASLRTEHENSSSPLCITMLKSSPRKPC
jgi:hypothetical protein